MDALNALIVCAVLVLGLAVSTVLLLRTAFLRLLVELCRSESHGRFWQVFASLSIVLTSLFGALISVQTPVLGAWREEKYLELVVSTFRTGLFGLLLALAGVALVLVVSILQLGVAGRERPVSNT